MDQKPSRAHRLSADLPAIPRHTTYKRSTTYVSCVLRAKIYDMLGTMHPGNTVPKGGVSIYNLQPKNSIGRVEISDRNGNRVEWGDDGRKMDGTSRDAHELPETEVVPHIHISTSTLSFQELRVRVLVMYYVLRTFEHALNGNVYIMCTYQLETCKV